LENNTLVESKERDTVMVKTKKGTRLIEDVLLVPDLKENILSIGQIIEKGYILYFKGDTCQIQDYKRQEFSEVKTEKRNRSFPLSFRYITYISENRSS